MRTFEARILRAQQPVTLRFKAFTAAEAQKKLAGLIVLAVSEVPA